MAGYTPGQLAVLCAVAFLLAAAALWGSFAPAGESAPPARLTHAYELSGSVTAPGVYRFAGERPLGRLLALSGAAAPAGLSAGSLATAPPNGSRIAVSSTIVIAPMRPQDRLNCFLPVPLKTAAAEDLALIPGMGPKTAQAVVRYRDAHGGIRDIAELAEIEGIGPKKLAQFSPFLTIAE